MSNELSNIQRVGDVPGQLERLRVALDRTTNYLLRVGFRGYDPYDALSSPLFRLPMLRAWRPPRRVAQQVLKRLPVNVRPLLGIRKGYNAVSVGLALQGFAYLRAAGDLGAGDTDRRIAHCISALQRFNTPGYSGYCWGYDFDWESRGSTIPAWTPTVVATGFVTNALFTAWELAGRLDALQMCIGAVRFVTADLNRTSDAAGDFCWSYSPRDREVVLNATMKGARLCAQVHSVTGDAALAADARRTVAFVAKHQRPNGSWPYSLGDGRTWADNFHTGYVLDGLREYAARTNDNSFRQAEKRGWAYYRERFFEDTHVPKYYDTRLYPVDATACAQSILTLTTFGDLDRALRVALWTVDQLQLPDGSFAYRRHRLYRNRIPYVRWSTAWMMCALGRVLQAQSGRS